MTQSVEDYRLFLQRKSQCGTDAGFEPLWIPDCLYDFQRYLTGWAIRKGCSGLFEDCGLGKGQPEGAMVLTPTGFKPNTMLENGDLIVSSNGAAYPITAIYVRGLQQCFRIHFSDGASFVVDADHLHIFRTNNDRQRGKPWRVASTRSVIDTLPIRYGKDGKSRNLDIPLVSPVQMERRDHWIHPYVVGVLLGDGCITKRCTITIADQQILATVRALLPAGWTLTNKSRYDYKLSYGGKNRRDFIQELRRLGILGTRSRTKFIPTEYLFDSVDNRVWLLRGLMDTDGWIKDTSQYYSTSKQLADDALMLIRSLGGAPTRKLKSTSCMHKGTRRQGSPCHVLTFSLKTFNPFHLARKAKKWNPSPRDNGRWIDRIEEAGEMRTICLSVGSPDQSYVTENHIVTHNTPQQLVWAENIVRKTGGKVLIMTPLAVSRQTEREAVKFGVDAKVSRDGTIAAPITITNYERLHYFDDNDFVAGVLDESSCIKAFDGKRRKQITRFLSKMQYRLLCSATPAPNDFIELGTSSEALGVMTQSDMLNYFFIAKNNMRHSLFKNDDFWNQLKWYFKPHSEQPFWRWVCSWARAIQRPDDLGFDGSRFKLPELVTQDHVVDVEFIPPGEMFPRPAITIHEQQAERKRSIHERCEKMAELLDHDRPAIAWCHYNAEGDLLEKLIPGSVQVAGCNTDDEKEERLEAFTTGQARVLVTKQKIAGWGLNWQHCGDMAFFPSFSYEQYYQAVRRCYRFGRVGPVRVHNISAPGESLVIAGLQKKHDQAARMFAQLVEHMQNELKITSQDRHSLPITVPAWINGVA